MNELHFLRHVLSPGFLCANPDNVRAVVEFPTPGNVKQVQQFLGLNSNYSHLTPILSAVAKPLSKLSSKSCKWTWGPAERLAMAGLKWLLLWCTGVVLPVLNQEFIIQTDSSGVDLEALLLQEVDGVEHPTVFASRGLTPAEANYSVPSKNAWKSSGL